MKEADGRGEVASVWPLPARFEGAGPTGAEAKGAPGARTTGEEGLVEVGPRREAEMLGRSVA